MPRKSVEVKKANKAAYQREHYAIYRQIGNAKKRAWRKAHRKQMQAAQNKLRQAHPERTAAHRKVNRALALGTIKKTMHCQFCWDMGQKLEGHHCDYSKQLEVVWLCRPCHRFIDRNKFKPAAFPTRLEEKL